MKRQGDYNLPRNSLIWLLVAQATVILPHYDRIPGWMLGVLLVCGFWRVMIWQGRWSYPPGYIKFLLVFTAVGAIVATYRPLLGLEALVAILITAFGMKLLEMKQQRDAFLLVMLAYFIIMTEFLFDQSVGMAALMVFAVVIVSTALIGLQQTQGHRNPLRTFRMGAFLVAQSIPVMLVLFVLFPRISPLWAIQINSQQKTSGMSDSMSPGDVAHLGLSGAPAFRVTFTGEKPPQHQLYWRGMTFSGFDGRTWTQGYQQEISSVKTVVDGGPRLKVADPEDLDAPVRYSVIMEPTHQPWLFTLGWSRSSTPGVVTLSDARMMRRTPVREKFQFDVQSWRQYKLDATLSDRQFRQETRLPKGSNPETHELARQLRERYQNDENVIDAILAMFQREAFHYTLRPPGLGQHSVDEFLFQTRRGFCEHYASSFVFLARAAGIPARVVAGYQGGEFNESGGYLMVHQFDAHAWAEVWYAKHGWVRYDPTGYVAPERIELGTSFDRAAESGDISVLNPLRYRNMPMLQWLRMQADMLDYYWSRFVLGYNAKTQMETLTRWFGKMDWEKMVMLLIGMVGLIYAITALAILSKRSQKRRDPVTRAYLAFCHKLARNGLEREPGEGPIDFASRASQHFPAAETRIHEITQLYIKLLYASLEHPDARTGKDPALQELRLMIRRLGGLGNNQTRTLPA